MRARLGGELNASRAGPIGLCMLAVINNASPVRSFDDLHDLAALSFRRY